MNRKKREGIVYSTNPDFTFEPDPSSVITLLAGQQLLYVLIDSKARKGKTVTLIKGFAGTEKDLEALSREIKSFCGTGGSVKNGEVIIQGNFRDKVIGFLNKKGYKTRKAGG